MPLRCVPQILGREMDIYLRAGDLPMPQPGSNPIGEGGSECRHAKKTAVSCSQNCLYAAAGKRFLQEKSKE